MAKDKKKKHKKTTSEKAGMQEQKRLDEIFDTYANKYNIDKAKDKVDELKKQIDREKYVYFKLHEKGLENTNIERLLDIAIDECKEQYNIKQNIENKVGLLLALWGVVITVLISEDIPLKNVDVLVNENISIIFKIITGLVLTGQIILGVCSLFFSFKTLKSHGYSTVSLRNKEKNFKGAVDDKYISIVQLLDSYTNRWIDNSEAIKIKGKYYKKLLYTLAAFVVFVVAGYICTY